MGTLGFLLLRLEVVGWFELWDFFSRLHLPSFTSLWYILGVKYVQRGEK